MQVKWSKRPNTSGSEGTCDVFQEINETSSETVATTVKTECSTMVTESADGNQSRVKQEVTETVTTVTTTTTTSSVETITSNDGGGVRFCCAFDTVSLFRGKNKCVCVPMNFLCGQHETRAIAM